MSLRRDLRIMKTFSAVIFDMDGVIVNSEPLHERAFNDVMSQLGYGDDHGMVVAQYIGRSDVDLWADFVARHRPVQSVEELLDLKRRRLSELMRQAEPIFDGLPELVVKLAAHGPLALASGSEGPFIEAVLGLKDLRRFFPVVVNATDVERGKPAPDIFLLAARLLGVAPAECWVIEDSKPGIAAALAAGMRVVAITNTYPAEELRQATCVAQSYEDVERLLLGSA